MIFPGSSLRMRWREESSHWEVSFKLKTQSNLTFEVWSQKHIAISGVSKRTNAFRGEDGHHLSLGLLIVQTTHRSGASSIAIEYRTYTLSLPAGGSLLLLEDVSRLIDLPHSVRQTPQRLFLMKKTMCIKVLDHNDDWLDVVREIDIYHLADVLRWRRWLSPRFCG